MSAGAFDITSGVLREAWSFDGSDNVPSNTRVNDILARVGWEKIGWQSPCIHLPQGMQIDLGGIGKEYAVDRATAIVLKLTNQPCLINFGGDIRASQTSVDQRGWQVGIESLPLTPVHRPVCSRLWQCFAAQKRRRFWNRRVSNTGAIASLNALDHFSVCLRSRQMVRRTTQSSVHGCAE